MLPARSPRGGFTLIELLVALVISAIISGAIFQLLAGQGVFTRYVGAREEVQQNARAAVELLGSELRSAVPGAVTLAERNAIRFHLPRGWGLLCNRIDRGPGSQNAWVRFPAGAFPLGDFTLGSPRWGLLVAQTPDPTELPEPNGWSTVTSVGIATIPNPCVSSLTAAPGMFEFGFSGTGFVPSGSAADSAAAGSWVVAVEDVRYDTGSDAAGLVWLRRTQGFSGSNPDQQPLVGPIPAEDGLVFQYFNANGAELDPSQLLNAAQRATIASVRVTVETLSTARFANQPQTEQASTVVTFRNRTPG